MTLLIIAVAVLLVGAASQRSGRHMSDAEAEAWTRKQIWY